MLILVVWGINRDIEKFNKDDWLKRLYLCGRKPVSTMNQTNPSEHYDLNPVVVDDVTRPTFVGRVAQKTKRLFSQLLAYLKRLTHLEGELDVKAAESMIRKNIAFRGPNVFILICAIIIASIGLNCNSIPVIIGAMLVSPLMGPILGFGMGLGVHDTQLIWQSLKNFAVMVGVSLVASSLYFTISPLRMNNPSELLARTQPTIYDVLIAFVGGSAGILETARKERGTVISGVAIATALMPPLCTVGYAIALWNWTYALGALYLFSINSIFIALATFLGVKYLHFPVVSYTKNDEGMLAQQRRQRRLRWTMSVVILAVMVPSILTAVTLVKQNNFDRAVDAFVEAQKAKGDNRIYDQKIEHTARHSTVGFFMVGDSPSDQEQDSLVAAAAQFGITADQIAFY